MKFRFLDKITKKFPNDFQLGQAVRRYYNLRLQGLKKDECEEIILRETFNFK